MKTEEEIRQYFTQYKFKSNPNHFIIVDKWNRRILETHKHKIFDYITAQKQLLISADETMICNPTALDVWIIKDGQPLKIPAGKSFLE